MEEEEEEEEEEGESEFVWRAKGFSNMHWRVSGVRVLCVLMFVCVCECAQVGKRVLFLPVIWRIFLRVL